MSGHLEAAITRLTWTVNLWGSVITVLVAAMLALSLSHFQKNL